MNNIIPFQAVNDQFSIRATIVNGEPQFVAKDIAENLGYVWHHNIIKHVPEEWRGSNPITTPGGTQELLTLSEQGLYFFLSRSDKPKALPFQKWIAGEVVPAIRKTGSYSTPIRPQTIAELKRDAVGLDKLLEQVGNNGAAKIKIFRSFNAAHGLNTGYLDVLVPEDFEKGYQPKPAARLKGKYQPTYYHGPDPAKLRKVQDYINSRGLVKVCALQVWVDVFGGTLKNLGSLKAREINDLLKALPGWDRYKDGVGKLRFGATFGPQKCYVKVGDF